MITKSQSALSSSLLNVFLVLIEATLTLILRFDANLRRAIYPLVKAETVVCIRTYLPHTEIYASFGYKGILLDQNLPPHVQAADITINAYTHEIIMALVGHNQDKIDALQMRGKHHEIALLRDFLGQLGVAGLFGSLLAKIRPTPPSPEQTQQKQAQQSTKIAELEQALSEQTKQTEQLTSQNRKLATQVAELQSKQKTTRIALIVVSLIALLAIVYSCLAV